MKIGELNFRKLYQILELHDMNVIIIVFLVDTIGNVMTIKDDDDNRNAILKKLLNSAKIS